MKKFLCIVALAVIFVSCNVQERIFFDENMGGNYEMSFDMSSMLQIANQDKPTTARALKKMDTLIVFRDMLEEMKDSIATLSPEKQAELAKLKNMTMRMQMDEANNVFKFSAKKTFKEFSEIAFVSNQMDEVFNMAKQEAGTAKGPGSDMLKTDKVFYTFANNTFTRVDEKAMKMKDEGAKSQTETESAESEMMKGMLSEFDDLMKSSKMTLVYSFPKKVKSVSKKDAVISEDGSTVTYSVDWKTLMDDKKVLENFEVILEEK